jgi:hypothetical protein
MELHGLAPWVGAGTFTAPYTFNCLFTSWIQRAKLITLGITCWDPTTGEISTDTQRLNEMSTILTNAQVVLNCGSAALVRTDAPDWCASILVDDAVDLPVRRGDINTFAEYCHEQESILYSRLTTDFPSYDWTDPIAGAVDVIDRSRSGSAESSRCWEYYRDILNPNLTTPDGPAELYVTDARPWRADIARCNQILAVPDDTANRIWRCDLAYRYIGYREAVTALAEIGL